VRAKADGERNGRDFMSKIIRFTLVTVTLLIVSACNVFRSTPISGNPVVRLTVQTQNGSTTFSQAGEIIHYNYVITNSGTTPLAGPVLVVDGTKSVTCPALNTVGNLDNYLDLNETITCSASHTISEADVSTASVTNVAVATVGGATSNQTGITLTLGGPQSSSGLKLVKTASAQTYGQVGETITYTYVITNTGSTPLGPAQFTISDNKLGAPLNCGPANLTLAPAENVTCTASYTITQADINLPNITSSATASGGGQTSASAAVTILNLSVPATQAAMTPTPATRTPEVHPTVYNPPPFPSSTLIRINFSPGQTTSAQIGTVNSNETIHYVVAATQGQDLSLKLTAPANEISISISDPSHLVLKPFDANPTFSTTVATAGDYYIDLKSLADASISYTLEAGLSEPYTIPQATLSITGQPGGDEYAAEEDALKNLPKASFQYLVPLSLKLNESFLVELDMSRSLTGPELSTQIVTASALSTSTAQAGTLVAPEGPEVRLGGGQVEVTPFMQAKLFSETPGAFEIQPLHDNPIQYLDPNSTVKWQWVIHARKGGIQNLIFVIYQQAKTNDEAHWHTLEIEKRVVQVNVTFAQRLGSLDWGWIAGTLITLLAIPALWRWYDQRKNRPEPSGRARQRRTGTSPTPLRESESSRLPGILKRQGSGNDTLGHIFISYRRSDSADNAGRIYDRLVEEFGPDPIFKDVDSIPLGTDFKDYLNQKVSECNVLLAIIGDRWVDASDATGKKRLEDPDDFVRVEIESALEKGVPVIPLLVRGAQMPVEENLPLSLRKLVYRNGLQIRPDPDFHHDMDRLVSALDKYIRYGRRA